MKKVNQLLFFIAALLFIASCNKVEYSKTKSGLLYKIYPGGGKDSLIKPGTVAKFNVIVKMNDSVMYTSYGKAPAFLQIRALEGPLPYNLLEILPLMRKGDSAITVELVDTLLKRGDQQLSPTAKKGDRRTTIVKIIDVFANDSLAMADYNIEMEKDRPRMMKEQEEQMAKMAKEREAAQVKEDVELEKSGEIAKELKEVEAYLTKKNIAAKKIGKGTYVFVQQEGTGAKAEAGKYVSVKYSGRILRTDSVFEAGTIPPFQLGKGGVIRGWEEGLQSFKQGGKGTLFIPGFLAYGKNPGPGSQPFEALIFDVEMLNVSDTMPAQPAQPPMRN
ncbi:MAG TPA: FKBP-type peptidyl-prolyl cis-trans isomerase [Chitinophagaceae bacterium]